jgi:hypothetical protein
MSGAGNNFGGFVAEFAAQIRDNTGITTTVAAAGTPVAVAGALFLQVKNTLPGAFVFVPATGLLTVANAMAAGVYDIEFVPGDTQGTNLGAKIFRIARNGVGVGGISRDLEPATAVRSSMAPAVAPAVTLAVGDTVSVTADALTNGHVVITRDGTLRLRRVG